MKKLLSILAVLAIVATCCMMGVGTAFAAEESSEDDFLVFDGVLEEYVGDGGDVVIPASLGVKEVAAQAFQNNLDITSIVFPEGVEVIGYWSVRGCENLEQVILPYTLEELAEHCFSSAAITEIVIPGNVEIVGYGAFSGCTYLEKITISYGVREIQVLSFQATAAPEVVFPETVELICGGSFTNLNYNGKYEYTICNPDCEIGSGADTSAKAYKHQWTYTGACPFNSAKYAVTFQFIVPKDSEVEAYLKSDEIKEKQKKGQQSQDDTYLVKTKDADYFEQYGENWGLQEPENNDTGNTSNQGNNNTNNNTNNGNNGNNTNGSDQSANSNNQNGTSGTVQYVSDSGNNSALIIVVAVIGGAMLLAVITAIILAATGVLFGKKAASASELDIVALKAVLKKIEEEEAKTNEEVNTEE